MDKVWQIVLDQLLKFIEAHPDVVQNLLELLANEIKDALEKKQQAK